MKNLSKEISVDFPNSRGKCLRGMMHLPAGVSARRRVPGVVMFHGFTGDRMESHWMFVKCSRALAQAGIASLRFDFYGSGESDGTFREMTLRGEIADARAAVEFFGRQKGIHPARLGLVGMSMGGAVAASMAYLVGARALVLWSAPAHTAQLRALAREVAKPIPGMPGRLEYEAREIPRRFLDDALKVEPIRTIVRFKNPTLIIQPEKDAHVPASHARDFHHASGAAVKELVFITGADHVYSSIPWEREVITRTVEWFRRHL